MTISGRLGAGAAAVVSVAGLTTGLVVAGEAPGTASALFGGSPAERSNLHCRTFVGVDTTGHLQRESEQGPGARSDLLPTKENGRFSPHGSRLEPPQGPSIPLPKQASQPLQT